jgi:hypothetical protein
MRYVVIMLVTASALAGADTIPTRLPVNLHQQHGSRELKECGLNPPRYSGLGPLWNSSLMTSAHRKPVGRLTLVPTFQTPLSDALFQRKKQPGQQSLGDFIFSFLQREIIGRQRAMSSYRGCKKSRDADSCTAYNGK